MSERIITAAMLVVAIIHLLPVSGFVGVEQLTSLYKVDIVEPNLEILMRHRAVLFGILGVFFAYAAFTPAMQPVAFTAGFLSISSFFIWPTRLGGSTTRFEPSSSRTLSPRYRYWVPSFCSTSKGMPEDTA